MSTAYNENSWYWTVSRINDLVAKYPDLFEDGSIRSEIERLETQWMEEQAAYDKEQISLANQPEEASRIANALREVAAEKIIKVTRVSDVTTLEEARPALTPSSPNIRRNTALALNNPALSTKNRRRRTQGSPQRDCDIAPWNSRPFPR